MFTSNLSMIMKFRTHIINNSTLNWHKLICWIMLFSFILIIANISFSEKYYSLSDSNRTVLITSLNQVLSEINFNERNSRVKNFEKTSYSLNNISLNLFQIDHYFDQSDIRNLLNSLSLLLTSSPNNHSFRGPPNKA